jgi:HK97 family phage major capsid protein
MKMDMKIFEDLKGTLEDVKLKTGELAGMSERIDDLERKMNRHEMFQGGGPSNGLTLGAKREMADILRSKSATIASPESGGHAVPEVIAQEVLKRALDSSPLASLVRTSPVSTSDYKRLISLHDAAAAWAGESTTRSETGTPTLKQIEFSHGELYAVPKASNWMLDDGQFDIAQWLIEEAGDQFSVALDTAIISGDGSSKPTGFLNGTPVSTGDTDSPARAFGTLQFVPTGISDGFPADMLGSPTGNPGDVLIDTFYTLRAPYRANATWVMSSDTARVVRKFKDGDGNYLWRPGLAAGQPETLLGKPVVLDENMPSIGANSFPIALADWRQFYELTMIHGMKIIRDEVTTRGFTLFYIAKRFGGKIVDDHACKFIKVAA